MFSAAAAAAAVAVACDCRGLHRNATFVDAGEGRRCTRPGLCTSSLLFTTLCSESLSGRSQKESKNNRHPGTILKRRLKEYCTVNLNMDSWDGGQNLKLPNVERLIFRKFETTKFRTADISKIRNLEYSNNESRVIWFFLFSNLFLIFTSVWVVRTLKILII